MAATEASRSRRAVAVLHAAAVEVVGDSELLSVLRLEVIERADVGDVRRRLAARPEIDATQQAQAAQDAGEGAVTVVTVMLLIVMILDGWFR